LITTRNNVVLDLPASRFVLTQASADVRCQSGTNRTVHFRTRYFKSDQPRVSHSILLGV